MTIPLLSGVMPHALIQAINRAAQVFIARSELSVAVLNVKTKR